MMLRALGGGELSGDKLVRFVYLDESGTGDPGKEPWVVVSDVMVHADNQLRMVEKYLSDMADDYIRPEHREGFVFHASYMLNGNDIWKDRNAYPSDLAADLVRGICEIPELFKLPIAVGHVCREELRQQYPDLNRGHLVIRAQAIGAMVCTLAVEGYMRGSQNADEVAVMVHEDNDRATKMIEEVHHQFRQPQYVADYLDGTDAVIEPYLPLKRVCENAFSSKKQGSALLQVADAVAFAINRKLRKFADADKFFLPLVNNLITWPLELGFRSPIREGESQKHLPKASAPFQAPSRVASSLAQLYLQQT